MEGKVTIRNVTRTGIVGVKHKTAGRELCKIIKSPKGL
jgi:hypothetical protein